MDEKKDLQTNPPLQDAVTDPLPDVRTPAIRTYKSDVHETVGQNKVTTAKILMAEQRKKQTQQDPQATALPPQKQTGRIFALLFGVLFLLAGVGAIGYFGYGAVVQRVQTAPVAPVEFFLFAFDNQKNIDATQPFIDVLREVESILDEASTQKENSYTEIIFSNPDIQTKESVRITSGQLFTLYNVRLPIAISGAIAKDFTYGTYTTSEGVEPFLVLALADYEGAYDAMFDWERTLALDIQDFFPKVKYYFNPIPIQNTPASEEVSGQDDVVNENDQESTGTTSQDTTDSAQGTSPAGQTTDQQQGTDIQDTPATPATSSTGLTNATSSTSTSSDTTSDTASNSEIATDATPLDASINRTPTFVDIVLSNRDTRAIRDDNGTPFFFYTFIERDKILFAQNPKLITEIGRKLREKQLVR